MSTALSPALQEHLGRLVRTVWVDWARTQPDPKPGWLTAWEDLEDAQQEVDRLIGLVLYDECRDLQEVAAKDEEIAMLRGLLARIADWVPANSSSPAWRQVGALCRQAGL